PGTPLAGTGVRIGAGSPVGRSPARGERRLKFGSILAPSLRTTRAAMKIRHALCALAIGALAAPAAAQQPTNPGEPAVRTEDWYRGQLVELSEVLGGSHYLRILCEGRGDQRWRNYMRGVI